MEAINKLTNQMKTIMKNFKLGYMLANDYNFTPNLSMDEFIPSFFHGIGYNIGVLKVKLFGYANIIK